jgi:PAS domain S-box-containing protein
MTVQRVVAGGGKASAIEPLDVLDAVEVPIVVVRPDLSIGYFNRAGAEVVELAPRLEEQCREVMNGGMELRADLRADDKWFVVRISPCTEGGGDLRGAVLTFANVTAFRASIDNAVYERECTKTILNTVHDPLVVLSADERILSANRAFYAMFGVSRDETQGIPLQELADGAFEGTEWPAEVDDVTTADGPRTLMLDAHPLSFPGHSERRVLVTFQDITARKRAEAAKDLRSEEELRRSETFLAEGQRLSSTGSFSWKVDTDEITWSEQLYRIYEFESGVPATVEMVRSRVHPEDLTLLEKMVEKARSGADDFEWHYRLLMPDQSLKYLQAVAHATRDHDGRLEYIAAVQDVTARRTSEDALAKARSELAKVAGMMSLGVLTASIAHEVNQPLAGIITNAGTCLRMLDANPPNLEGARQTARRTIRDGNRAADVITRLRALFTKDELTLEPLDLNEVTREVIALSSNDLEANRVVLQSEFADDLPVVPGDRIQLQQVILNLLRNGSDAMVDMRDGRRLLRIRTEREADEGVRVSVRDIGVGVEPQTINKLLDPFYSTKSDGMGIGLSVSRSIIERHHGRLWAEPNDGPGATFSFSIPSDPESVR